MAYRLLPFESIEQGVQRIAVEQLDLAMGKLRGPGDLDTRVHDLRKHLKKLRGLVRLVRFELGQECFEREMACFRDAGRALGAARASAAWLACLDDLGKRFAPNSLVLEAAHHQLIERRAAAVGEVLDARVLPSVEQKLDQAKTRVSGWAIRHDTWKVIGNGLTLTYARGRQAMKRAYAAPEDALFHDWRKRVKYQWCHVRLLQDLWHKPLKMRRRALKQLSDLLGDDHDLAELRSALGERNRQFSDLIALAHQRQAELRLAAQQLGQRVYAERPKQLERRFSAYFSAWRMHSQPAAQSQDTGAGR